jgi:putative nucleotidyltransferase with HDIG domain
VAQEVFHQLRLGKAIDVAQCLELVEAIAAATSQSAAALMSLIRIKKADEYTFMHSIAVSGLMMALARTMGMQARAVKLAGFAGFLHDIGKAFIPLEVLNKEGRLSTEEFALIARHAVLGYESLRDDPRIPDEVKDVCLHHHEKMDGSGYPHQLSAPDISIYARMAAICDV